MTSQSLNGKRIAFLVTDGVEQVELTQPWEAVKSAGAEPELISLDDNPIQGMHHSDKGDTFSVDKTVAASDAADYDGLVLPGGLLNPDTLRMDKQAVAFIKAFFEQSKPVAAICHGPWTLIEAGVVKGRTLTSWPSLQTDIRNAGGNWVDQQVCVDQNLITSRNPDDLDAFCSAIIDGLAAAGQKETTTA